MAMCPTSNTVSTQGLSTQGLSKSSRWNVSSSSPLPPRMVHRLLSSRWSSVEAADSSSPRLPKRRESDCPADDDNDASPICPARKSALMKKHLPTPPASLSIQQNGSWALTMCPTPNTFSSQGLSKSSRWNVSSSSPLPPRMVHRLLSSRWSSTGAADSSSPRLPARRESDCPADDDNEASPICPAQKLKRTSMKKHLPTPPTALSYQQNGSWARIHHQQKAVWAAPA